MSDSTYPPCEFNEYNINTNGDIAININVKYFFVIVNSSSVSYNIEQLRFSLSVSNNMSMKL